MQKVLTSATPDIALIDAMAWNDAMLREAVTREFGCTFALDRPLLRVRVFRGSESDLIVFDVHRLVIDASSIQICFAELKQLYVAELNGSEAVLSPLEGEFREFVGWEASIAGTPNGEHLWEYWRKQLEGELPILQLPSFRPRPRVLVAEGDRMEVPLRLGLLIVVQQTARKHKTTPYTFLLAAYSILLRHYTRQDDMVIGSGASLRIRPSWANAVGCFINLLPLRIDTSENPSFAEHLLRIRDVVLGALEHQNYPFALTVKRLRVKRNLERSPVFQAFFNFLTDRAGELGPLCMGIDRCAVPFGPSTLTPYTGIPQQEGQWEIVLRMAEVDGELFGNISYNTAILDRSVVACMAESYPKFLNMLLENPDLRINDVILSMRRVLTWKASRCNTRTRDQSNAARSFVRLRLRVGPKQWQSGCSKRIA
jgi:hypothetical protein